jgi:hypothetical protein
MAEPVSVLGAVGPILKAAEFIDKKLVENKHLTSDDAKYYGMHLENASQAIHGLEEEYIEILIQASEVDLEDEDQKRELSERIKLYIKGEILRPRLMNAIKRLVEDARRCRTMQTRYGRVSGDIARRCFPDLIGS